MKSENKFHAESPLLAILDQRHSSLELDKAKPYKKPKLDPLQFNRAVQAHAEVNKSDPFAANRIALHMKQGYVLPSDVLKDTAAKQKARAHATHQLEEAA